MVKAIACEVVYETARPLSRQSLGDLTVRACRTLSRPISRSTVWRMLHAECLKPWRYEYWIFPRDLQFAEKAAVVLDLYAGFGKANSSVPVITSSVPMKRRASKPACGVTPAWVRHPADIGVSSSSTTGVVPCNIWRPGMSGEGM